MTKQDDASPSRCSMRTPGSGRLTASIPIVPGTISDGRTRAEARRNVLDALRTMLSVEPDARPKGATMERVNVTLGLGRGQARERGRDR